MGTPPLRRLTIALSLALACVASPVRAQSADANPPQTSGLRAIDTEVQPDTTFEVQQKPDTTSDEPTTGARVANWALPLAAFGGSLYLAYELNAPECNWCDRGPNGEDTLNGFDRWARNGLLWSEAHRDTAARGSDLAAGTMVVLPYLMLWPKGHHAEAIQTMTWVFAFDSFATVIPKRAFARQRPQAHFNDTFATPSSHENASFPSNHTSRSFASLFAAVRLCQMTDCPHEERIWWTGLPIATAAGLLRIGADKHYAIDVLAGAGIGAAIGWYTPAFARSIRVGRSSLISALPTFQNGIGVTLQWTSRVNN